VEYSNIWEVIGTFDSNERTLFGLIDNTDGKYYTVEITKLSTKKHLTDEQYHEETKKYYLSLNSKNRILKEEEIQFHGDTYYKHEILFHNNKWGLTKLYDIVKRNEEIVVGITISFPIKADEVEIIKMPSELTKLNDSFKIQ